MQLSEKIALLRKNNNYSQDKLAEKCNVSRQAISKWEKGLSIPDLDNLRALSEIFKVSLDVLIKDDLNVNAIIKNETCHTIVNKTSSGYYSGILIKESISDENILDVLNINKVELWKTDDNPKYWTAMYFTSNDNLLPEKFSEVMISDSKKGGNWYVDFYHENIHYVIFRNKILKYEIGNKEEKAQVIKKCNELGILDIDD